MTASAAKPDPNSKTKSKPRGRPGLTQDARNKALQVSCTLMAERGIAGMQARTIAQRSGLSIGSIYKLFGDIDDLIREVNLATYREFAQHHSAALDAASKPGASVQIRLMALANAYVEFVLNNEARWTALLSFNANQQGEGPKAYKATRDQLYEMVESVMCELPDLSVGAECAAMTRALWASVHGIVIFTLPNSVSDDPVAETLAHIERIVSAVVRDNGG
jgi:AcrR family transcriptional regulator